jgi:SynChlorMet cassette protein ScmC
MTHVPHAYRMRLANQVSWSFHAMDEVRLWLHDFARILGLEPGTAACYRMFFITQDQGAAAEFLNFFGIDLPWTANGWRLYRHSKALRFGQHPISGDVVFELNADIIDHDEIKYIAMWTALRPVFGSLVPKGGTPVHGASAALDGKGVLIAASGGTGKTTCYNRLPSYWEKLADDQALIVGNGRSRFRIHPLPSWSEYLYKRAENTWDIHQGADLCAVFLLEQDNTDAVVPVNSSTSAYELFKSCREVWESHWARLDRQTRVAQSRRVFENAADIVRQVPVYHLKATLIGRFWEAVERVL